MCWGHSGGLQVKCRGAGPGPNFRQPPANPTGSPGVPKFPSQVRAPLMASQSGATALSSQCLLRHGTLRLPRCERCFRGQLSLLLTPELRRWSRVCHGSSYTPATAMQLHITFTCL